MNALFTKLELFLIRNNRRFVLNYDDDNSIQLQTALGGEQSKIQDNEIHGPKFDALIRETGIPHT